MPPPGISRRSAWISLLTKPRRRPLTRAERINRTMKSHTYRPKVVPHAPPRARSRRSDSISCYIADWPIARREQANEHVPVSTHLANRGPFRYEENPPDWHCTPTQRGSTHRDMALKPPAAGQECRFSWVCPASGSVRPDGACCSLLPVAWVSAFCTSGTRAVGPAGSTRASAVFLGRCRPDGVGCPVGESGRGTMDEW